MQRRRRKEEGEKAAVRVKGERGGSRFTVTFSPVLYRSSNNNRLWWLVDFFGRHFMFLNGCHVYLAAGKKFFLLVALWKEHIRQMSLLLRLANFFFFFSFFCGNGSAWGGGKTNKNGASEQEGLFLPLCLRPGNTARKNKKVANVLGVIFLYSFFRGKET